MSHHGGNFGFSSASSEVIGKVSAKRSNAHGAAIPHRTLPAKGVGGSVRPFCAGIDLAQLHAGHAAVTAIGVAIKTAGKSTGQRLLVYFSVRFENGCNGDRHFGIVGM